MEMRSTGKIARLMSADDIIEEAFRPDVDGALVHAPRQGTTIPRTIVRGVKPSVYMGLGALALGAGAAGIGYLTDEERPWNRGY
jgi:hypothetical protein